MSKYLKELIGKTVTEIRKTDDEIYFNCSDGSEYKMWHNQNCCESVSIDDICGDLSDLENSPITMAEEVTNTSSVTKNYDTDEKKVEGDWPDGIPLPEYGSESYTWTFYKLATNKGSVTIRWYGSSNGYYSESVEFGRKNNDSYGGYDYY